MKKLFFISVFLLLALPQVVLAYTYKDCEPKTSNCFCSKADASASQQALDDTTDNKTACQTICTNNFQNSTRWWIQCNVGGIPYVVETGLVTAPTAPTTTDQAREMFMPRLSVEIPGFNPELSDSFFSDGKNVQSNLLGRYIEAVYQWLLVAGSLCAVVLLMVGGLQWAIAAGDPGKVGKAKDRIVKAIFGLALLFGAYTLAFLIDPGATVFKTLSIQYIPEDLMEYPAIEEEIPVNNRADLSGNTAVVPAEYFTTGLSGGLTLDPLAIPSFQAAAKDFFETTGIKMSVTSGTRSIASQAKLFYENCLENGPKKCIRPTGNPANTASGIIGKDAAGNYILTGQLAGVTDPATIIAAIVANPNYAGSVHLTGMAVDVWCKNEKGFIAEPKCQQQLQEIMWKHGWCRIPSEAWHFELSGKGVATTCGHNVNSFTVGGKTYTPDLTCARYRFSDTDKSSAVNIGCIE